MSENVEKIVVYFLQKIEGIKGNCRIYLLCSYKVQGEDNR